jgi:glycosyltransferase involved in cell wall biosynthesis
MATVIDSATRVTSPQWFAAKVATPVSLILPMFNEAQSVETTMRSALEQLDQHFIDYEIIVADDASTDDCAEQVERWTRNNDRIKLVRLSRNERFGGALRAGFAAGSKEYLVYTDFDLPVPLADLPRWLEEFANADVLTGHASEVVKHTNWRQSVISKGYNFLVRSLFGVRLRDINFGFKAVRKTVIDEIVLRSKSPFVDAELFVQAQRSGFRVKEVAVPFSTRQFGTSHIRRLDVIACTFWDMLRLRVALLLDR